MSGAKTDEASSLTARIEFRFGTDFTDISLHNDVPIGRRRVFIGGSDVVPRMSGLGADLDAIAAAAGYDDTDAVVEEAVRELLRRRPELRLSLAVEKYRTGAVSLNRGAKLAGVSTECFKRELSDRGIDREAGFLSESAREDCLETFLE